ncbi:hypothetical protein SCLCIDRAFT_572360 [Scleroderma citrinum Foug A]|uniref:Uncharacterized protein n=1 Tax=Scleroderma citrinum Foug A TaxID=1036808 RepID=A0A0C3D7Z5_9AGAM|nr:hypothetical protein SCLCIDRAFT_572360 [Scleroderma citrinum Foug A]
MDDIHNLSSGEFHIFSDVNGHPIDLCRTPPAAREPVIVGNATLRFTFKAVGGKNTYEIWADGRHIRNVGDHIYGSLDAMVPQRWVVIPHGNGTYIIETQDRRAWSDPGGNPGCEHKVKYSSIETETLVFNVIFQLYLHSVWDPIGPQQTFRIKRT